MKKCTKCGAQYTWEHIEDLYRDHDEFQLNPFICDFCFADMRKEEMKITHIRADGTTCESMKGVKAPEITSRVIAEAERRQIEKEGIDSGRSHSDNNIVLAG